MVRVGRLGIINPFIDGKTEAERDCGSPRVSLFVMEGKAGMELRAPYLIGESIQDNEAIFNYKTVLRCGRSYEDDVRVALSTLTRQNKKRMAINTIGISGTIKSGIDKFIEE